MKEQIVKRMFWSQLKHLDFAGLRVVINKLVDSGYCLMPTESANLIFNRGYCCNFVRIEYCEEGGCGNCQGENVLFRKIGGNGGQNPIEKDLFGHYHDIMSR